FRYFPSIWGSFRHSLFPYSTLFRSTAQLGVAFEVGDRHARVAQAAHELEPGQVALRVAASPARRAGDGLEHALAFVVAQRVETEDRKSTRLNSSHVKISYAVFCLKK